MEEASESIAFILFLVYACLEGSTHAMLFSERGARSFTWNEHIVFVGMRFCVLAMPMLGIGWYTLAACALCYAFFHNGSYYTTRHMIDGSYPDEWFDMSTSSSAKFNLTPVVRTVLMFIGVVTFLYGILK